jgi:hypothetical protein
MGSKRFALQGIEYAFLCAQSIIEYGRCSGNGPRPETETPRPGWYVVLRGTAGFAPKCTRYAHPAPKATRRRLAPTSRATSRSAIPLALGLGRSALSLSSSMPVLVLDGSSGAAICIYRQLAAQVIGHQKTKQNPPALGAHIHPGPCSGSLVGSGGGLGRCWAGIGPCAVLADIGGADEASALVEPPHPLRR